MLDFRNINNIWIPQNNTNEGVKRIFDKQDRLVWEKPGLRKEPFYIENTGNSSRNVTIAGYVYSASAAFTIEKSTDMVNWVDVVTITTSTQSVNIYIGSGVKMYFRADTSGWGHTQFTSIPSDCIIGGNILSLIYGSSFTGMETKGRSSRALTGLFKGTQVKDAHNLILADVVHEGEYSHMFYGCTLLTEPPILRSIFNIDYSTPGGGEYSHMFYGCTSLVNAPALPSTVLGPGSYSYMFYGCTSLIKAPELPATTLKHSCYSNMFEGCTSLEEAPYLPATALVENCYQSMFEGCTNLKLVKCNATEGYSVENYTRNTTNWLYDVAPIGTFYKNANVNDWASGGSGIPSGWTVIDL